MQLNVRLLAKNDNVSHSESDDELLYIASASDANAPNVQMQCHLVGTTSNGPVVERQLHTEWQAIAEQRRHLQCGGNRCSKFHEKLARDNSMTLG